MKRTDKATWLLALDGSPDAGRAAQYVARVARMHRISEIHLLNVQPMDGLRADALRGTEIERQAAEVAMGITAPARAMLKSAGLSVRLHAPIGSDPAVAIAAAAQRHRAREIVMGTRGKSAAGNLALGSVAYKVIHIARQAVTLVPRPRAGRKVRLPASRGALRVLLAVDGSAHASRATAYVCALQEAGVPLTVHLLNVQPLVVSGNVRRFISQAEINAYFLKQGEIALRPARRRLDRAGVKYQFHVNAGPLAETIVSEANERRCTRIIMGTRGLGSIKGLILGSVTHAVVHLAETPVTLVK